MATPTYRSINLTATLLGIDRRLCIVILIVTFLVFRHDQDGHEHFQRDFTVLSALVAFVLLWSGAYWLTKHDPELVVIVPKALGQRNVYDPGKTTNKRKGRVPARFARSINTKGGLALKRTNSARL